MGEQVEGLLRGYQQLLTILRGEASVAQAQAAHRRLGRGERRAQVMADRRQQGRPSPVRLGRPRGLPGQAAEYQPPGADLCVRDPAPSTAGFAAPDGAGTLAAAEGGGDAQLASWKRSLHITTLFVSS
jgi:hypothetical protein